MTLTKFSYFKPTSLIRLYSKTNHLPKEINRFLQDFLKTQEKALQDNQETYKLIKEYLALQNTAIQQKKETATNYTAQLAELTKLLKNKEIQLPKEIHNFLQEYLMTQQKVLQQNQATVNQYNEKFDEFIETQLAGNQKKPLTLKQWVDDELIFRVIQQYFANQEKQWEENEKKKKIPWTRDDLIKLLGFFGVIMTLLVNEYFRRRADKLNRLNQLNKELDEFIEIDLKFYADNGLFSPSVRTQIYYASTYDNFIENQGILRNRLEKLKGLRFRINTIDFRYLQEGIELKKHLEERLNFEEKRLEIGLLNYQIMGSIKSKQKIGDIEDKLKEQLKQLKNYKKQFPEELKQIEVYTYNLLGLIKRENKLFHSAIDYFLQALAIDPNQPNTLTNLGRLLNKIAVEDENGNLLTDELKPLREKAYELQQKANQHTQYNPLTSLGLAISLYELARCESDMEKKKSHLIKAKGYFLQLIDAFEQNKDVNRNNQVYVINYATRFLINTGDQKTAEETLKKILNDKNINDEVKSSLYYNDGIALANLGKYDESIKQLEKAKLKLFHQKTKRDIIEKQMTEIDALKKENSSCFGNKIPETSLTSELYSWSYTNTKQLQNNKGEMIIEINRNAEKEKLTIPTPTEILNKLPKLV